MLQFKRKDGEVNMREYDDYFRTYDHIKSCNPEAFVWKGINSTGLAEVMELAEQNGYTYKLNCYDEALNFNGEIINHHVRSMIFTKEK